MQQFGGKDSKRHFTVVMGNKEHGLYVSSTPSSAAKKAVTKLCAANKKKKVEFSIREITQGSKKKTYGPYLGYVEKLKEPIELEGRVIKYKPVAKLSGKSGAKKGGASFFIKKVSEFNINKNGKLTREAKQKMFENFKIKNKINQQDNRSYHYKKRIDSKKPNTLYFGLKNNLIEYSGNYYYPYSITLIPDEKNGSNTIPVCRILFFKNDAIKYLKNWCYWKLESEQDKKISKDISIIEINDKIEIFVIKNFINNFNIIINNFFVDKRWQDYSYYGWREYWWTYKDKDYWYDYVTDFFKNFDLLMDKFLISYFSRYNPSFTSYTLSRMDLYIKLYNFFKNTINNLNSYKNIIIENFNKYFDDNDFEKLNFEELFKKFDKIEDEVISKYSGKYNEKTHEFVNNFSKNFKENINNINKLCDLIFSKIFSDENPFPYGNTFKMVIKSIIKENINKQIENINKEINGYEYSLLLNLQIFICNKLIEYKPNYYPHNILDEHISNEIMNYFNEIQGFQEFKDLIIQKMDYDNLFNELIEIIKFNFNQIYLYNSKINQKLLKNLINFDETKEFIKKKLIELKSNNPKEDELELIKRIYKENKKEIDELYKKSPYFLEILKDKEEFYKIKNKRNQKIAEFEKEFGKNPIRVGLVQAHVQPPKSNRNKKYESMIQYFRSEMNPYRSGLKYLQNYNEQNIEKNNRYPF
jgi:hypothetical protein